MKKLIRIVALALAMAMMLVLCASAFAASLSDGAVGGFTQPDTPATQEKSIVIKKEITAYNPDSGVKFVYGPAITYTYTLAAAADNELVNVTDETTDHASGQPVTTKVLAGVSPGDVSVAGTEANKIAWTNADILDVSVSGTANYKNLTISFSNVVFSQPGVYRYKITESAESYTTSGVTKNTGNTQVRYLDVYVMRSADYGKDASGDPSTENRAGWWTIYGYVCIDSSLGTTAVTASTAKTNGFVDSDGSTGTSTSDEYRTYNLTIGKTLSGDASMNGHKFPFDVTWTAGDATGTFQFIAKTTGTAEVTGDSVDATTSINGTDVAAHTKVSGANAVGTDGKDGSPKIANGGTVKYIGIPVGTKVTVTETNDVAGTTYTTTAKEKIGTADAADVAFTGGTAILSTDKKTATTADTKTVVYAQAGAPTAGSDVTIQYTNTLALISPTGYVVRFAPYALMLIGGVVLLVVAMKHKKHSDEE